MKRVYPEYHETFVAHSTWLHALHYIHCKTMEALSNVDLARQTDREDCDFAENPELARELFDAGACWTGLRTVGMKAHDWYHLGQLIADEGRDDWMDWLRDSALNGETPADSVYEAVQGYRAYR